MIKYTLLFFYLLSASSVIYTQVDSTYTDEYNRIMGLVFLEHDTISKCIGHASEVERCEIKFSGNKSSGILTCKSYYATIDSIFYEKGEVTLEKAFREISFTNEKEAYITSIKEHLNDSIIELTQFYSNGEISSKGSLNHGLKDGYWTYYYDNGKLNAEGKYNADVQIEDTVISHEFPDYFTGEIMITDTYGSSSAMNGTWYFYKRGCVQELEFRNGVVIKFEFGGQG